MARRSSTSKTAARSTGAATSPIGVTFKHVEIEGGHAVVFDLEVRAGDATRLTIANAFQPDRPLFQQAIVCPATCSMREIRVSTDRPLLRFSNAAGEVGRVQVDLSAGRVRAMGTAPSHITVR